MFALAQRQLAQAQRSGLVWLRSREVGLEISEAIAHAVNVCVGGVRFDVAGVRVSHAPLEQMVNELQQWPRAHAQSTPLVALILIGLNASQCSLAV